MEQRFDDCAMLAVDPSAAGLSPDLDARCRARVTVLSRLETVDSTVNPNDEDDDDEGDGNSKGGGNIDPDDDEGEDDDNEDDDDEEPLWAV
jgi:hypothetical protein